MPSQKTRRGKLKTRKTSHKRRSINIANTARAEQKPSRTNLVQPDELTAPTYTVLSENKLETPTARHITADNIKPSYTRKRHQNLTGTGRYISDAQGYVKRACVTVCAIVIIVSIVITSAHKAELERQASSIVAESAPEIETVDASEVSSLKATKARLDSTGRYVVHATMTGKTDDIYNVSFSSNVTVSGTDKRGEAWSGTLNDLKFISDTENCVWVDDKFTVVGLSGHEAREITLYPDFSEIAELDGITIDRIDEIEFLTQSAVCTADDPYVIPVAKCSLTTNLNNDGDILSLYGTVDVSNTHATHGTAHILLITKDGSRIGAKNRDHISFPFAFQLKTVEFTCNETEKSATFSDLITTDGTITRAKLLGVTLED